MANPTGWKPSMEKGAAPGGDAQDTGLLGATRGLQMEEPLVFEQGSPGRIGVSLPPVPAGLDPAAEIPAALLRGEIAGMPEMAELEVVRHFTRLSQWNWGIDTGFYPLGSCTMKYNPKSSEALARLPGFAALHPLVHFKLKARQGGHNEEITVEIIHGFFNHTDLKIRIWISVQ
jgi:glycine dehydrogenase subunit 2